MKGGPRAEKAAAPAPAKRPARGPLIRSSKVVVSNVATRSAAPAPPQCMMDLMGFYATAERMGIPCPNSPEFK